MSNMSRWSFGFVFLAAAGCATSPAATSDDAGATPARSTGQAPANENVILVSVNHNRADGGIATIYIEPTAGGVRETLGTIEQGTTKTFSYSVLSQNRTVRLIALNALGQSMTSSEITVPRGAGLNWDLGVNSVRVRR